MPSPVRTTMQPACPRLAFPSAVAVEEEDGDDEDEAEGADAGRSPASAAAKKLVTKNTSEIATIKSISSRDLLLLVAPLTG